MLNVRRGSVTVRVYCVPWAGKKRWEVRWKFGGKIHRLKRTSKKAALLIAGEKATLIANGQSARYRLSEDQAWEMEEATRLLAPLGKTVLEVAYSEAARAKLVHPKESIPVAQLVERFVAAKATQELSPYHLRDLEQRLGRFAADMQIGCHRLTPDLVQAWLDGLKVAKRTKGKLAQVSATTRTWNNYRAALAALFDFGLEKGLLEHGSRMLAGALPRKLKARRPQVFTPAQMRLFLEGAGVKLQAALALGAFAGLRTEEICRLHWADINWERGTVLLRASVTKTARTRQVPMSQNLVAWLKPWSELGAGKVSPYQDSKSLSGMKWALARRLGLKWQRNALRKSFISYRLALVQDVAKVALEAGNSPAQIHAHYLDLVSAREAKAWFEICPKTVTSGLLNLRFA